jgi:hypothetical protein
VTHCHAANKARRLSVQYRPRSGQAACGVADTDLVIDLPHGPSGLSRATWTDADFAAMGWHDCRIHAVRISEYDETLPPARLLLD